MTVQRHLVRRALALIIDLVVVLGLLIVAWQWLTFATPDETGNYGLAGCFLLFVSLVFWWLYFAGSEALFAQTLGKGLMSLRVLKLDGRKADLIDCTKRHLLDPIEFQLLGVPAAIAVSITATGQRLGDLLAGTQVVKEADTA